MGSNVPKCETQELNQIVRAVPKCETLDLNRTPDVAVLVGVQFNTPGDIRTK